jgi:hypothetical protein
MSLKELKYFRLLPPFMYHHKLWWTNSGVKLTQCFPTLSCQQPPEPNQAPWRWGHYTLLKCRTKQSTLHGVKMWKMTIIWAATKKTRKPKTSSLAITENKGKRNEEIITNNNTGLQGFCCFDFEAWFIWSVVCWFQKCYYFCSITYHFLVF